MEGTLQNTRPEGVGEGRTMDPLIQRELGVTTLTAVQLQGGQRGGEQVPSTGTRVKQGS